MPFPAVPYAMANEHDDDMPPYAWAGHRRQSPMTVSHVTSVTTKIPPSYDGKTMTWFAYEEAIDDWCDMTELEKEKWGPALKSRLIGDAAVYRPLLDRDE